MAAPDSGWPWAPKLSSSGSQQKPEEKAGIYQSALEKKEYDGEKKKRTNEKTMIKSMKCCGWPSRPNLGTGIRF